MDILNLFTNPILLIPGCAWITAQIAKTIINFIVTKKFSFDRLVGDGGMPSGHSATVTALAVMCGLTEGFGSTEFGLAMIFAIVVMHDAMGVRREAGKHAKLLNLLVDSYEKFSKNELPEVVLKEFVGHTPLQVTTGIILGILCAFAMHFFVFA